MGNRPNKPTKNTGKPNWAYRIINAILFLCIFVPFYKYLLEPMRNQWEYYQIMEFQWIYLLIIIPVILLFFYIFRKSITGIIIIILLIVVLFIPLPYNPKFAYIFFWNFVIGVLVSIFLRLGFNYYEDSGHPLNDIIRNVIQSLFYSFLLWIGIIAYFFDTLELIDLAIAMFGIKIIVFLLSDFLGDKIAFGG